MKKLIKLMSVFLISTVGLMAQNTHEISGVVKDNEGLPLPGATILIKPSGKGTVTNFNGEFNFTTTDNKGELEVSFIGYITKIVKFTSASKNLEIVLESSSVGLKEVVIFASRAIDRKTPVAYSTIKKNEIEQKLGNQEFVEILKSTPGVFTTRAGGGFGDGEITMRGFNSENVSVLINGIPVNDYADGRVFWSNWAGIGNVTSSAQTQRGLGASKLAVSSIGGTMNIITQSTDAQKGGRFEYGVGNDGYTKYGLKLSTGLMENGFAVTTYVDRTFGDGYVDGTPFESVSYFGSISKKINDDHKLVFFSTGAPQRHGGRFNRLSIQDFRESERGIRTNLNWGIKNGEIFSLSENFFHKPIMSLAHYWKIDDKNKLSTSVYYSNGLGGVSFGSDNRALVERLGLSENRLRDNKDYRLGFYGPIDIDRVVDENIANGEAIAYIETRTNKHEWIGGLSTFNSDLSDELALTAGIDIRYGYEKKTQRMKDLLGGEFILDDNDVNNPNREIRVGDDFGFSHRSSTLNYGGFGQIEYDYDQVSAFVATNVARTEYQREYFYLNKKPAKESFIGFGGKGGANYRLDNYHNIFFNGGYFERAPFLDAVWQSNNNADTNRDAVNQKIFSLELGYGLRTEQLAVNVNVYRTQWNDRTEVRSLQDNSFLNITGINALHQGLEIDFEYRPFQNLTVKGMASIGDWNWKDDVNALIVNPDPTINDERIDLLIKDLPVGRSAQTTAALNVKYDLTVETSIFVDYNYYDRYYSDFEPTNREADLTLEGNALETSIANARRTPWEVPSYHLVDISLQHKFKIGALDAKIIGRMNNVFDNEYITLANDGGESTAADATVFFGPGRTFSVSSIINF